MLESKNYLNNIVTYLDLEDITKLSLCNKKLKYMLNPENNSIINSLFFIKLLEKYIDANPSSIKLIKKTLLSNCIKFQHNWKSFFFHIKTDLDKYKNTLLAKKVLDNFKVHIYLPDLRREGFNLLDEENHEVIKKNVDSRKEETYDFYSKYFTVDNVINHPEKKEQIKLLLKENLFFEESLINFKELFQDFSNNKELIDFVNKYIIEYHPEHLDYLYTYNNSDIKINNSHLSKVIHFILWISHIFQKFCILNYEYINCLFNNVDINEIVAESLKKKTQLVLLASRINRDFENINNIINSLTNLNNTQNPVPKNSNTDLRANKNEKDEKNEFDNKDDKFTNKNTSNNNKFTLYNLLNKCIYDSYLNKLNEKFTELEN